MRFLKNYSTVTRAVFFTILIAVLSVPAVEAEDTCVACHKDPKFATENRVLFEYFINWTDSTHEIEDVKCTDCHGGDSTKSVKEEAHGGNFLSLTSKTSSYKEIPRRCGRCHEEVFKKFTASRHYKALLKEGTGPHCSTCHGSVNANVYYTSIISRACEDCHNEYTKNRPEVVGEADKILHRINVSHAYKRWVLIDFHFKEPEKVDDIIMLYKNVAESWHTFNFKELDQKSLDLLNKIKSLVNRGPLAMRQDNRTAGLGHAQ